jgi:hypothetical protein
VEAKNEIAFLAHSSLRVRLAPPDADSKTYAFSNQWGRWTEKKMSELIAAHGDDSV